MLLLESSCKVEVSLREGIAKCFQKMKIQKKCEGSTAGAKFRHLLGGRCGQRMFLALSIPFYLTFYSSTANAADSGHIAQGAWYDAQDIRK